MWIEPTGFEQVHARGNLEPHRLQRPDKWTPYGVGAIEGRADGPRALEAGAGPTAPAPPAEHQYGPGEEPRPREGEPTATANHELL